MSTVDIVRAWKDADYRSSLSVEEQALLPEHPAGPIELADGQLQQVVGASTAIVLTAGCCPSNVFSYCFTNTCCDATSIDPNPTGCCGGGGGGGIGGGSPHPELPPHVF